MRDPESVLTFWFGDLDPRGRADEAHSGTWWRKDEAFDAVCRERFGDLHRAVVQGACDAWLAEPRGRLAFVLVLDQLSRNMFRGTPGMFAHDRRALEVARETVERRHDRALPLDPRTFLYLPFMHSEALADQDECVALFSRLRDELPEAERGTLDGSLSYAEQHRAIVRRFGRFPHRNVILGRPSTPDEVAFLEQPGSSF